MRVEWNNYGGNVPKSITDNIAWIDTYVMEVSSPNILNTLDTSVFNLHKSGFEELNI